MNLITIQTMKDRTKARQLLNFESLDPAIGALYQTLASSVVDDNVNVVLTMVMDDNGNVVKRESWIRENAKA